MKLCLSTKTQHCMQGGPLCSSVHSHTVNSALLSLRACFHLLNAPYLVVKHADILRAMESLFHIVTWRLKDEIQEPEETVIAREWLGKHVPTATNTHAANNDHRKRFFLGGLSEVCIITCRLVRVTLMMGSSLDDWILLVLRLQILLITISYNAIAILHTFSSPLHTHQDSQFPLLIS
jgi:hypothetical protein